MHDIIKNRRSIRSYTDQEIDDSVMQDILESAIMAPSAKNRQPWRFYVINHDKELIKRIASLSAYNLWLSTASALVVVFLDKSNAYDDVKDVQSIGAAIQNMLLEAYEKHIGSCWVGEILKNEKEVTGYLGMQDNYKLMAVISLGYIGNQNIHHKRKSLQQTIIDWK